MKKMIGYMLASVFSLNALASDTSIMSPVIYPNSSDLASCLLLQAFEAGIPLPEMPASIGGGHWRNASVIEYHAKTLPGDSNPSFAVQFQALDSASWIPRLSKGTLQLEWHAPEMSSHAEVYELDTFGQLGNHLGALDLAPCEAYFH